MLKSSFVAVAAMFCAGCGSAVVAVVEDVAPTTVEVEQIDERVVPSMMGVVRDLDLATTTTVPASKVFLFAGHSFFEPAISDLNVFTEALGVSGYQDAFVFAGGDQGSPEMLWANDSTRVPMQSMLDAGNVALLGLTYHPSFPSTDGYVKWIDYALSRNSELSVMVGWPWSMNPGEVDSFTYGLVWNERYESVAVPLVDDLRALYPDVSIFLAPFGFAAVSLYELHEEGMLPSVSVFGEYESGVFSDGLGHPGRMLSDLATLIVLDSIYDVDLLDYTFGFSYDVDLRVLAESVNVS